MRVKLFVLTVCFLLATNLFAQTESISLKVENMALADVFKTIQEKSGYRFFYSDDLVDLDKSISIDANRVGIQRIMNELESQTNLTFRLMEDKLIVVVPIGEMKQAAVVTGKVTSASEPQGLPGVTVVVKGTTNGVVTDINGNFQLEVPDQYAVLSFSFIGFQSQEVPLNGKASLNVVMATDVRSIDEVVVTALAIERDKESLGYSISQVGSDEISQAKENNVMNSLAGKVAGLQISTTPSGVDGSTRVVLRGVSSLSGNNRPLIVIDGIPVAGGSFGGGDHIDRGDAMSDINPEDVESMSVLKGAGASAAYGSRGANGVILITTKKGSKRKGIGIKISSNFTVEQAYMYPEMQNVYGQGAFGQYPSNIQAIKGTEPYIWSWGPKMEGQMFTNYLGQEAPYEAQPNPYKEFYKMGTSMQNTVAFEGGDADANVRASITNQTSAGIVPDNTLSKQTLNLRGFTKLGNVVDFDGKVTYIHHNSENRPYLSEDSNNAGWAFNNLPRNISLDDLKNNTVDAEGREIWAWDWTAGNPYWGLENKQNFDTRDRIQTLLSANWHLLKNLNLLTRSGFDFMNRTDKEYAAAGSRNQASYKGWFSQGWSNSVEWNTDALLTYKTKLSDEVKMDLNIGGNYRYNQYKSINQSGSNWRVPNFFNMSNLEEYGTGEHFNEKEVWSALGLGQISWKNYLYFDFTLRNDWSSTLPTMDNQNSYFYHSENLSFLFTEMFDMNSSVLTSGKLRASYAKVGNDTGPYNLDNYYSVGQSQLPYSTGGMGGTIANANLMPENTYSWEVGTNLDFWNNRLEVDFTYYDAYTINQIMRVKTAVSSGWNDRWINSGELANKGFELQIDGTAIDKADGLRWDISFNMAKNMSEVVSLYKDDYQSIDNLVLKTSIMDWAIIEARVGGEFGEIYGVDYARDDNGNILVDQAGFGMKGDYKKLGSINPDFIGGFSNHFSYKDFHLSFVIDFQMGGEYYSHSSLYRDLFGTGVTSLEGREEWYSTHQGPGHFEPIPGIFPDGYIQDGVNVETGQPNDIPIQPIFRHVETMVNRGIVSDYIMDASNVRFREIVFGYTVPSRWLNNTFIARADLSLVGRNLFFLYLATDNIDPEAGFDSGNFGSAFELNTMPGTRSYGFNINLSF
ncbi:SusC/RagA family TonB-linked outer membrane protein [Prolixibacteraceae bacterium Z1-6]|uniref:SusC/RagA family TonB-linked outer membrane protein n=1 Tax=Draconibacterium aestuarii TaxID=2998507 RepID=A0A9X3F2V8_9BACT|nr:SusC/RagA family TonB-linked outer membrane protein [Prolixibacteraceae bacterium Z1-6]